MPLAPDESLVVDPLRASWLRFTAPLPEGVELVRSVFARTSRCSRASPTSSASVGHVSLYQDVDGVVRSLPLVINHQGRMFPSLPLLMAARQLDADSRRIQFARGHAILPTPRGEVRIPVDAQARMLILFPGNRELLQGATPTATSSSSSCKEIADAMGTPDARRPRREGLDAAAAARSRWCATRPPTSAIADFGPTPFDVNFPLAYAHASVVNSILRGDYLQRVPRDVQVGFWAVTALVLGVRHGDRLADRRSSSSRCSASSPAWSWAGPAPRSPARSSRSCRRSS